MADSSKERYKLISSEAAESLSSEYTHAAHVMLYAPQPAKLFGKYDQKYVILMQLRFDGTLGFPGGIVEEWEIPSVGCMRECCEELGVTSSEFTITPDDLVAVHYCEQTHFCLHFFAKEISLEAFEKIEKCVLNSKDWGKEVMGVIRCSLVTLPNGLGLPAFLKHKFIGNAFNQLLLVLRKRNLLSEEEMAAAIKLSGRVNTLVTVQDTDI